MESPSEHQQRKRNAFRSLLPVDLPAPLIPIRGAFQSALNLGLGLKVAPGYAGLHHSPACPLPSPTRTNRLLCEGPAAIGYETDDWSQHSARFLINNRGQRVFVQQWLPLSRDRRRTLWRWLTGSDKKKSKGSAKRRYKGILFIVHGLNGHSGNYVDIAKDWVKKGYAVLAHDLHGHGRSEGARAYAHAMQHYVEDAWLCARDMDQRLGGMKVPKFLLGHSLGGAIAIHMARDDPRGQCAWNGVMLTAPAVKVYPKPLLKMFAPIIAALVPMMPVQKVKFDKRGSKKGGEKPVDPLTIKSPVRARLGYEILKSCEKIMNTTDRFGLPSFVAHSKRDRATNPEGSIDFVNRIASKDKTLKLYDGDTHDLLDGKRDIVVADMIRWADKRLRRRPQCRLVERLVPRTRLNLTPS